MAPIVNDSIVNDSMNQVAFRVPKKKPSSNLASRVERWHKRLSPQFPDIDPHDLELILTSLLRRPRERMQMMFLKKRKDGRYVF